MTDKTETEFNPFIDDPVTAKIETDENVPTGMSVDGVFANHDPINNPQHYQRNPAGIEVIDITEHLSFNQGNAVKYILRAPYKDSLRDDLKKAIWCLKRELQRIDTYGIS